MADRESVEILGDLLKGAIPVNPAPGGKFATHEELDATIHALEAKIELAAARQKNWVLGGVIATIMVFGGGYVSLVSKLDRLTETLPVISKIQQDRGPWIQRQEQHDTMQDQALQKLDNSYQPLPYEVPPQ